MKTFSKRLLTMILAAAMVFGLSGMTAFAAETDNAEAADPGISTLAAPSRNGDGQYEIATVEDLEWFAEQVNWGNNEISGIVTADIDASKSEDFSPIGISGNRFLGTFDGDGHTITVDIESSTTYTGLFGMVDGAAISNLTVDGSVSGSSDVGGIAGYVSGAGSITNCVNKAAITGTFQYAGGIAGCLTSSVNMDHCLNYGTVTGWRYVGGLVGQSGSIGAVTHCGNEGAVTATATDYSCVGGIIGFTITSSGVNVSGCYNKGDITGDGYYVGGIIGENNNLTIVDSCYNTGTITGFAGTSVRNCSGGIVGGGDDTTITNVFNTGKVDAAYAGALMGGGFWGSSTIAIANGYYLEGTADGAVVSGAYGEITTEAVASKTAAEIMGADFVELINENGAFKKGCEHPLLTWEEDAAHTWGAAEFTWSENYRSATASRNCTVCGETETVEAEVSGTEEGDETVYTATATFPDGTTATDTRTVETSSMEGHITIRIGGETRDLFYSDIDAAIEAVPEEQTFTYGSNSVTAKFVLLSSLLDLGADDYCSYTVTAIDNSTGGDAETTGLSFAGTYLYKTDSGEYRTAINGSAGRYWIYSPTTIEVNPHTWDVEWAWEGLPVYSTDPSVTYDSIRTFLPWYAAEGQGTIDTLADEEDNDGVTATAKGTCSVCGATATAGAEITSETDREPTEWIGAKETYTAAATFADGTRKTDTKSKILPAGGSIDLVYKTITGNTNGTITYEALNELIDQVEPITITYRSHSQDNTLTMPFVPIADAVGVKAEDVCCFYAECRHNDHFNAQVSRDAYLYQSNNNYDYRTAVNGGQGSDFVTEVDYIEVQCVHTWGTPTWTWNDDHSSASVSATCAVSVCDKTDSADAVVTSDSDGGKMVYTATATLCDGTVVTDTQIVDIPADKTGLEEAITEAEALHKDDYTQESWDALGTALADAKDVDAEEGATQESVDKALEALESAIEDLEAVPADKEILEEEIAAAADLNGSDYTTDSWAALEEALAAAEAANGDPDALQSAVDAAAEALETAMDNLEAVPADKDNLEEAIEEAGNLTAGDYTKDSWAALEEALAAAEEVCADPGALQSEVEAALEALKTAMDNLEPASDTPEPAPTVDKENLEKEITEAEDEMNALNKDGYTADSWKALEEALANAQAVAADPDATQEEVEAAEEALKTAMDNLAPVVKSDYTGFVKEGDKAYYMESGVITGKKQGIIKDTNNALGDAGAWYYVIDSEVQYGFTGLSNFSNENGWWYIVKGKVDFSHNGVDQNNNGWWYVTGGKVQFGYTGVSNYSNANGWWYIKSGKVDFTRNSVDQNKNGWWYVTGGKVQFGYTGVANYKNANGWWYIKEGKVDFTRNSVDKNNNGWWYVTGGKVQFGYTGVANYKNTNGWWYIQAGKVDFTYNGRASNRYGTWNVVNGKVVF